MGEFYSFEASQRENQGCWAKRTCLEKTFIVFNAIFFLALAGLGAAGLALHNASTMSENPHAERLVDPDNSSGASGSVNNQSPCLTPGCVHAASTMLSFIDSTVEPCDDFYQFACGSFVRDTVIPEDRAGVNIFSEILDTLQLQIRQLIAEPVDAAESGPVRMAKQLYAACLNKTRIEERGVRPTLELAARFGGWPVLSDADEWDENGNWSWLETNAQFGEHGVYTGYIFSLSVQTDLLNSSVRTLDMDQTALGIDREYLVEGLNDTIVQAYYQYMVDVSVVLGANRSQAEEELKESLEFEIELAKIGLPNEERRNATALHNPMPLHAIQAAYPYVQWLDYLRALLPKDIAIDENEIIVVTVPEFFAQLADLMARTPKRTVANYLLWRVVEMTVLYAADELRDLQHAFERKQSGQEEKTPRWQECIDTTSQSLPISMAALYVRKHFQDTAKHAAVEMAQNIRHEFEHILQVVPWMDEETRAASLQKMQAMIAHIGYPDELDDDRVLSEHFRDLRMDEDKFLESVLRVNVFDTRYEFGLLRQIVNKTDWVKHSKVASLNAQYRPTENSIIFPAGILQGRFFSAERPAYLNYGAIGFVIGHEITHGFDDKGRQFDLLGNVHAWWQSKTLDQFLERTQCIIEQFGNYTEKSTNLTLNGIRTQGENIADSGGVKIAYNAYRQWAQKNGGERQLPGLTYTPQQLFWISAAQNWCSVLKEESIRWTITTDQHSPDVFRVLGPLQNSAQFAEDFGCAAQTPMNPTVKCGIW